MKIKRRKITSSKSTKSSRYIQASRKYKYIRSADEAEETNEDDLEQVEQEFSSADTSINSTKLPAIYKLVSFPEGSLVLDYGGGKFDNGVEFLAEQGVTGLVYDPYNRSQDHNRNVVREVRSNGGADITLCSNVLNVIKEPEARLNVLKNIRKLTKPTGKVYITVYEGKGTGEGKQSKKDSYQLNRKTADYLDEVHQVFPDAERKGKLIYATPSGDVTASTRILSAETVKNKDKFVSKLKKEVQNKLYAVMKSPEFGFLEDEIDQYSFVEIRDTLDGVMVEVRAEVSYDGMVKLAEALDPIVQRYDEDAYFDQEDPGIMNTFIRVKFANQNVTSAEEINYSDDIDLTKTYDYDFDFNVEVTDDIVDLASEDEFFPEIYDDEYDLLVEGDVDYIVENLLDLIYYNVPEEPGIYRVSGIAKMKYNIYGLYEGYDSDGNFYVTDSVTSDFDRAGSWVENLQVQPV